MYYLGFDIGSSSIKASIVSKETGKQIGLVQEPEKEMGMISHRAGWAEQDPESWWVHLCKASRRILQETSIDAKEIQAVGISYQMHGLVVLDKSGKVLRPSIIWCDGRAVSIGDKAYEELGADWCTEHLLNSPGNFTASKLKWLADNEPSLYNQIFKIMLPGDYIAYRLTGDILTTVSGLSEGIFWDFQSDSISSELLEYYQIDPNMIPDIAETFGNQGGLSGEAARETGLPEGTPVMYRAGDQPNNALTLNVFQPGEVAATAGTSGVFYAVTDSLKSYQNSGVNNFIHVNHTNENPRIGKLLCINGAGIQYRWLLNNLKVQSYEEMNVMAREVPIGSEGLKIFPFGNGPERMFGNVYSGASFQGLDFNTHSKAHLCRAALEGIAFSMVYGMELLQREGIKPSKLKAGNDNMFRSHIFSQTIANLIDLNIDIYDNTGATGAARACNLSAGDYSFFGEQVENMDFKKRFTPANNREKYLNAYELWREQLEKTINTN